MKKFLLLLIVLLSCPITGQAGQLLMPPQSNGLYNYHTIIALQDEFLSASTSTGSVGMLGWLLSGGVTTNIASETNRLGLIRRDTSAVINTIAVMYMYGSNNAIDPATNHSLLFMVRPNQIDNNTTIRVGAYSSIGANPPTYGFYIEKLDGDTNWFCVTNNAGTQTRVDSTIAATTTFQTLAYTRSSGGVQFNVNSIPVCDTITTNIPTIFIDPAVQIVNSAAASKTIDIDYFEASITISR